MRVKAPPPERRLRAWSQSEVTAFLAAAEGERLAIAFVLALTTGLRRGELLGLRWNDLDLDTGALRVQQAAALVGGRMVLSRPKTPRSRRLLCVGPGVAGVFQVHRVKQEAEIRAATEWHDQGLVFSTSTGKLIDGRNSARTLTRIAGRAGERTSVLTGSDTLTRRSHSNAGCSLRLCQRR